MAKEKGVSKRGPHSRQRGGTMRRQTNIFIFLCLAAIMATSCKVLFEELFKPYEAPEEETTTTTTTTTTTVPAVPCDCYKDDDCGDYSLYCDDGVGCEQNVTAKGLCTDGTDSAVLVAPASIAIELFEQAFSAYEQPIRNGGGHPNAELWAQVDERAPSQKAANLIKRITNQILGITLGRDFALAVYAEPSGPGNISLVQDPKAMLALMNASKQAVLLALQPKDGLAIMEPLERFWKKFPDYEPGHTGRCYEHGHPWIIGKGYERPIDCHIDGIYRRMYIFSLAEQ